MCIFPQMTELQLEILFGGMGYEVQNVRIVEDIRTGASKGYVFVSNGLFNLLRDGGRLR